MPTQPLPYGLPHPPAGWLQKPPGISLCMIVKNEERFLERCLQSVAGIVDEINVVDTGSTDATVEIAQRFGARVEHHAWRNDFAWARNRSVDMAGKRWVLQLDADEELLPESAVQLRCLKAVPAHTTGLFVRCSNLTTAGSGTGVVNHAVTRLFPNHAKIRYCGRVHEYPAFDGASVTIASVATDIKIVHYGYLDELVKERKKQERNMQLLEACVAEEPDSAYHWYNLGLTAHVAGQSSRAAEALCRMWEICKSTEIRAFAGNGLQILSSIYSDQFGDPQTGLDYALECLRIAPHYANAHFAAGRAYTLLGDYEQARAMHRAAIEDAAHLNRQFVVDEDASGWKPAYEIALTYQEQSEWENALAWFERALQQRPNVRIAQLKRAFALENLARLNDAETAFETTHAEFADEESALQYVNYLLRHNRARAVNVIDQEYSSLPVHAAVPMLLAAASIEREQGGDGERHLLAASALEPASAQVQTALEEFYRLRGDFARARESAQSALELDPANSVLRYNAAIDCVNLGMKDEALQHLRAIPGDGGETGSRAAYLRAVLLRELGRLDEAMAELDRILISDPAQLDALLLRGAVLDAAGRKGDAESAFQAALPVGALRAAIELAGFYLREGRPHDAKRIAEEALAS